MMFLYIGMLRCAYLDMFDKFLRREIAAARLATFHDMHSDHFIADRYDPYAIFIGHPDRPCRTDVGAGPATDTESFSGYHKGYAVPFLSFERPPAHDFAADPNT